MKKQTSSLIALALLVAACGGDADTTTTAGPVATAAPSPTTAAPPAAAGLAVADSALGEILVDGSGKTLYLFVPDAQGDSTCYDECEQNWPPLTGEPVAGDGIDAALIGTTTRTDGTVQATFNGWPLYRFGGDAAAGDANGQGLNDVWYVVSTAGDAIQ